MKEESQAIRKVKQISSTNDVMNKYNGVEGTLYPHFSMKVFDTPNLGNYHTSTVLEEKEVDGIITIKTKNSVYEYEILKE